MFSNLILRHVWIQHFLSILTASGSLLAVLNSVVSLSLEKHQQGFFYNTSDIQDLDILR